MKRDDEIEKTGFNLMLKVLDGKFKWKCKSFSLDLNSEHDVQ